MLSEKLIAGNRNYIKLKEEILKLDSEADFVITDSYEVIGGLHKYEEEI